MPAHRPFDQVVLLLFNAGPLDITFAMESTGVSAVLWCGLPGQSAGDAVLQTVQGQLVTSRPAGRLTVTWPGQLHQVCTR